MCQGFGQYHPQIDFKSFEGRVYKRNLRFTLRCLWYNLKFTGLDLTQKIQCNLYSSHIRKNLNVHIFGIFVVQYSPFELLFSNEYNFFFYWAPIEIESMLCSFWLLLFDIKKHLRSSLSVSQQNPIIFVLYR